jgi:hypothetical protein
MASRHRKPVLRPEFHLILMVGQRVQGYQDGFFALSCVIPSFIYKPFAGCVVPVVVTARWDGKANHRDTLLKEAFSGMARAFHAQPRSVLVWGKGDLFDALIRAPRLDAPG